MFRGHRAYLSTLKFSPDQELLLSACYDRTVRVWDFASRQSRNVFQEHPISVFNVEWNATGDRIASSAFRSDTRFWPLKAPHKTVFRTRDQLNAHVEQEHVLDLTWHPDSNLLAAVVGGYQLFVWNVELNEQVLTRAAAWSGRCAWHPSGSHIALSGYPKPNVDALST